MTRLAEHEIVERGIGRKFQVPSVFNSITVLEGIGCFEGYSHQATLAFFYDNLNDQLLERLYDILKETCDIEFGLTKTKKFGLLVRILGTGADYLVKVLLDLKQEIYSAY